MKQLLIAFGFCMSLSVQAQPSTDSLQALFTSSPRSVPLAFGMSAIIPGTGQAYNRHWVKSAIALVGEASVLLLYRSWRSQGRDGRDAYEMQAHGNWSPIRYAYWLNDYANYLNQLPNGRPITAEPVEISSSALSVNLAEPDTWSQSDQLAIRSLIQEIQRVERALYHGDTGAAFSHVLPFFGEQQYYELIGKYFQYAPGWDDYVALIREGRVTWVNENGEFITSIEPEAGGEGDTKPNVSPKFYQYAEDHADANTYLRKASRITTLLIVNHIVSAIDAAVFARIHNQKLQMRLGLLPDLDGRTYIAPYLSLSFGSGVQSHRR